jgi:hypothetical protein
MQPWHDGREAESVRPQYQVRVRREVAPTRDMVNARQYEHWQADTPALYNNRNDPNAQNAFMDMAPLSSRQDGKSYRQAQPYVVGAAAGKAAALAGNPFFQKFDVTQDPRNVARELRGSVFEEKTDRGRVENKALAQRDFQHQWVDKSVAEEAVRTQMTAAPMLRPQFDDTTRDYRLAASGGWSAADRGSWAGAAGW